MLAGRGGFLGGAFFEMVSDTGCRRSRWKGEGTVMEQGALDHL